MFVSTSEMRVNVTLDGNELSDIAYSLHDSLASSVERHYKKFNLSLFLKREGSKIRLMRAMFSLIGRGDIGQSYAEGLCKQISSRAEEKDKKPN